MNMGHSDRTFALFQHPAPGRSKIPSNAVLGRSSLTPELQKHVHILGPTPKRCLEQLADLGMSDQEIGLYFRIPRRLVTDLRENWGIEGKI